MEVAITHCGICHSDIHLIDNDWGFSSYPLVPGHEVIGNISAAGTAVAGLSAGQRVGIGWQRSSCMACEWCLDGKKDSCPAIQAPCVGHHGGFSAAIGTRSGIHEMLRFAALHGISPQVELMPLAEFNAAIRKARSNRVRYRVVLKV